MSENQIPRHVAIVMDGNGRWATKNGKDRIQGHQRGAQVALDIVRYAAERGVKYLTLYTFSSENWRRPDSEVQGLMQILYENLLKEADSLVKNGVHLGTIGATDRLPANVRQALSDVCQATSHCDKLFLTLALSYGSRDEIARACQKMVDAVSAGHLKSSDIDEDCVASFLDTAHLPDPDILIRTSGEHRLSNFLLWQSSYSELFFLPVLWPDFSKAHLDEVLAEFTLRERRYGQISDLKE